MGAEPIYAQVFPHAIVPLSEGHVGDVGIDVQSGHLRADGAVTFDDFDCFERRELHCEPYLPAVSVAVLCSFFRRFRPSFGTQSGGGGLRSLVKEDTTFRLALPQ